MEQYVVIVKYGHRPGERAAHLFNSEAEAEQFSTDQYEDNGYDSEVVKVEPLPEPEAAEAV